MSKHSRQRSHHLEAGKIVALRGLGGYQLLVDATNQAAVERLRERKGRRAKPLAVMVESVEAAERLAYLRCRRNARRFPMPSAPIVLVRARADNGLAAAIHPHLDTVGLMRPTTPLHAMLAGDFGRPLVCTSGNRDGEPLEYQVEAAEQRSGGNRRCVAASRPRNHAADRRQRGSRDCRPACDDSARSRLGAAGTRLAGDAADACRRWIPEGGGRLVQRRAGRARTTHRRSGNASRHASASSPT